METKQTIQMHTVEAKDSWKIYLERQEGKGREDQGISVHRRLKHHHQHNKQSEIHHHRQHENKQDEERNNEMYRLNHEIDKKYLEQELDVQAKEASKSLKALKKRGKNMKAMYNDPGIKDTTVHGIMIDAGSTGTRLHLYEWNPRLLHSEKEVEDAVSGGKLSYPGTDSRWTDRLRPGLATFADLPDDQLVGGIATYLEPLMDFAKTVLHRKQQDFGSFPVYLRATAGMRIITDVDRARVVKAVRMLFSNNTFCPFQFEDEQARVLSGEEEAIYGWTGVNFLLGTLIEDSVGAGTVIEPRSTYGALDMGGASTQISFYEPTGDIMASLFKLQIGQGKHWNLYAHSFLYYGINEARDRLEANLIDNVNWTQRLVVGIYNPCLPGGTSRTVRSAMHIKSDGYETWSNDTTGEEYGASESIKDGFRNAIIKNENKKGDFDKCNELAYQLLHKKQNNWCDFSHRGDCSFAGTYQPDLPDQSERFGEFLAFSNYLGVWQFLDLPSRSSLRELEAAARVHCEMSLESITKIAKDRIDDGEDIADYCFRSAYVFQILHNGYGFELDDYVTSTGVVSGQKVGWALGAMLYEINTLPWHYNPVSQPARLRQHVITGYFAVLLSTMFLGCLFVFKSHRNRLSHRMGYEVIKTVNV